MALRATAWDVDLMVYVESVLGAPFEWGRTDCWSLICGALRAMYGDDVLNAETYGTKTGALKAYKAAGSYNDALAHAGAREVPINFRQRGDIAILPGGDIDGFPGVGVVMARGRVLTVDETVKLLPLEKTATIVRFPHG